MLDDKPWLAGVKGNLGEDLKTAWAWTGRLYFIDCSKATTPLPPGTTATEKPPITWNPMTNGWATPNGIFLVASNHCYVHTPPHAHLAEWPHDISNNPDPMGSHHITLVGDSQSDPVVYESISLRCVNISANVLTSWQGSYEPILWKGSLWETYGGVVSESFATPVCIRFPKYTDINELIFEVVTNNNTLLRDMPWEATLLIY